MEMWAEGSVGQAELMAVVGQEMPTPVLGLEALLDSLSRGQLSSEPAGHVRGHSRVLARQVMLLREDLSLMATPEAMTPVVTMETLDLDQQLTECLSSFPDIVITVEGDERIHVYEDALRVQQICANLLRSTQRLGRRPVSIQVKAQADYVSIRVSDSGPANGYEMAIVRRLVSIHGGTTIHEVGGSFVFTLPRALPVPSFPG